MPFIDRSAFGQWKRDIPLSSAEHHAILRKVGDVVAREAIAQSSKKLTQRVENPGEIWVQAQAIDAFLTKSNHVGRYIESLREIRDDLIDSLAHQDPGTRGKTILDICTLEFYRTRVVRLAGNATAHTKWPNLGDGELRLHHQYSDRLVHPSAPDAPVLFPELPYIDEMNAHYGDHYRMRMLPPAKRSEIPRMLISSADPSGMQKLVKSFAEHYPVYNEGNTITLGSALPENKIHVCVDEGQYVELIFGHEVLVDAHVHYPTRYVNVVQGLCQKIEAAVEHNQNTSFIADIFYELAFAQMAIAADEHPPLDPHAIAIEALFDSITLENVPVGESVFTASTQYYDDRPEARVIGLDGAIFTESLTQDLRDSLEDVEEKNSRSWHQAYGKLEWLMMYGTLLELHNIELKMFAPSATEEVEDSLSMYARYGVPDALLSKIQEHAVDAITQLESVDHARALQRYNAISEYLIRDDLRLAQQITDGFLVLLGQHHPYYKALLEHEEFAHPMLRDAISTAVTSHALQLRKADHKNPQPYAVHVMEVAMVANKVIPDDFVDPRINLDEVAPRYQPATAKMVLLVASFLHDAPEDTKLTLDEVEEQYGKAVRQVVGELTLPSWLDKKFIPDKAVRDLIKKEYQTLAVQAASPDPYVMSDAVKAAIAHVKGQPDGESLAQTIEKTLGSKHETTMSLTGKMAKSFDQLSNLVFDVNESERSLARRMQYAEKGKKVIIEAMKDPDFDEEWKGFLTFAIWHVDLALQQEYAASSDKEKGLPPGERPVTLDFDTIITQWHEMERPIGEFGVMLGGEWLQVSGVNNAGQQQDRAVG